MLTLKYLIKSLELITAYGERYPGILSQHYRNLGVNEMASIQVEENTRPAAKEKIYKAGDIVSEPGLYRRVYPDGREDDSFFYVNHHEEVILIEPGIIETTDMSDIEYTHAKFIRLSKRTTVTITLSN